MRPARLPIHQRQPNPSAKEREILVSVAEVWTPQDAARHLDTSPRTITAALHRMRDRYNLPTNEAAHRRRRKARVDPASHRHHRRPKGVSAITDTAVQIQQTGTQAQTRRNTVHQSALLEYGNMGTGIWRQTGGVHP
ncbi:MAG: hypothetical protein LAP86_15970 [Acidobacteriia bacterium]|nr:hypothetical protein [Terriglobia bacterium]